MSRYSSAAAIIDDAADNYDFHLDPNDVIQGEDGVWRVCGRHVEEFFGRLLGVY